MLALTIREKNGDERQLIFDKEEVTIGRATGSDIVLPRSNISKRHARLVDKHDKVVIVDLRSTNGTYVNGRRITAPELLTYDDKVYIGDFVIRLSKPSEQHPSQRMTSPYSASPTPAEPRAARAATSAASEILPAASFSDEDGGAPPEPPTFDASDDDDASTRAIDSSMADAIDNEPEPEPEPPPVKRAAPAKVAPVAPVAPPPAAAPKARAPEPPAPPPTRKATEQNQAGKMMARGMPEPEPEAKPRGKLSAPPQDDDRTMHIAPAAPPAPPRRAEPPPPSSLEPEPEDAWAQWNHALAQVIDRVEREHPEEIAADQVESLVHEAIATSIEAGEISSDTDREALAQDAIAELSGLGPFADLEADTTVRAVYANGPRALFAERGGVIEPNGRVFATARSYRRALKLLLAGTGLEADAGDLPGLEEARLPDGSSLRIVAGGVGAEPLFVWRRRAEEALTLADFANDRVIDAAQARDLEQAIANGKNLVVSGPRGSTRGAFVSALAQQYGLDRRVVLVGDGTQVALPHANVARVPASAFVTIGTLAALEPQLVVFESLDGRVIAEWTETCMTAGCPVLAVAAEGHADRVLKRLGLALEVSMGPGLAGRGAACIGEAVDVVVTLMVDGQGQARCDKVAEVEATRDGFALRAPARR